ncbi:MAG: hypothetical protein AB7E67_15045 [Xanthobacteraceae bacterium]
MTRFKNALMAGILILISAAIGLLVTEAGYRLFSGYPLLSTQNLIQQRLDMIRNATGVMDFDELVGWRLKANLFKPNVPFTTGEFGLRMNANKIVPVQKGSILAVGDSFTAGSGVAEDESWPARLEARTGQPVANGSAGAYGVDQIVLRAEQLLPTVQPKILIVGILSQDSLRNSYSVYGGGYKPYFDIVDGKLRLRGVPVRRVDTQPLHLDIVRNVFGRFHVVDEVMTKLNRQESWTDNRFRYQKANDDKTGVAISCLLMERLAALSKERDIRVAMVMMYGASEIEGQTKPWYAEDVVQCALRHGIETLDTYGKLRAILASDRPEFVRLWLDEGGQLGHMSPYGNDMVAKWAQDSFFRTP